MKILNLFLFFLIILLAKPVFAQQQNNLTFNQFITVVNPVRISIYSTNPKASLLAQYLEVQKRSSIATWLLNFDVISDAGVVSVAQTMDKSQELGIFLEITPKFASESGVIYNKTDSWHRANSVFLSGYTQEDRHKLIDKIFEKFRLTFGFYPSSVGAWWTDSYSLDYMKQKYNIISNLAVSDQFSTDGYQVWGQYWSTPFYPSKLHAGMPATSLENKLDILTFQWAPRDPLNGYGRDRESLYSTQDYFTINLSDEYFERLVDLYSAKHQNKFGHITVGLEGDLSPGAYKGIFARQLDIIKAKEQQGAKVITMKEFSNWYRNNFKALSPIQIIQTDDLLGKKIKTIWYQSPNFRINIIYNYKTKETKVRDFRTYHDNFQEPYYFSPNRDLNLSINLPSQVDYASNPDEEWTIFADQLENVEDGDEKITLNYKKHKIKLTKEEIEIVGNIKDPSNLLIKSAVISIKKSANKINLRPQARWNFSQEGFIFRALTQEGTYFLRQRKIILLEALVILFVFGTVFFVSRRKLPLFYKTMIIGCVLLVIIGGSLKWYLSNSRLYFVNQSELDALIRLKLTLGNRIVVYDKVCLQCSWHTQYMPAIFANKRDYVRELSSKEIIYNSSVFEAKTRPEAKKELEKLNADYIYLVKFEDYRESIPFSPGDLNIEEIYSNANAQIWKVKQN